MSFLSRPSASSSNPSLAWSMGNGGKGRMLIRFPMKLDDGWYREQPCTTFHTFEHRKERKLFKHEFIVLRLLDGSVCRIERMGDPDARFDAISPRGSVAHDMAQCFRPDELEQACLDTSDIISTITLPFDCDLMDVLKICRAIHEGEKTRNYTLQVYNCYFFSLAIQACLTRLVAHWEDEALLRVWLSLVDESVARLPHALLSQIESPSSRLTILELCSTLALFSNPDRRNQALLLEEIKSGIQVRLARDSGSAHREISNRINGILWHSGISLGLNQFIEDQVKEVVGEIIENSIDRLLIIPNAHASDLNTNNIKKDLYLILTDLLSLGTTNRDIDNSSKHWFPESNGVRAKPLQGSFCSIPNVVLLDFKETPAEQVGSESILADWCRWIIKHLPYLVLKLLYTTLGLWGLTILMPEMNSIPLVSIEDKLGQALTKLECLETPGYSNFEQFVKDLRSIMMDGTTVWYKNPWNGICGYIIQHIQFNMLEESEKLGPTIRSFPKGQHEAETLSISTFQRYILSRIKLQAEEVQSVWLGSAVLIEAELKAMLSEVWKTIRDDDGFDITRVTETEMMGTDVQDRHGLFNKPVLEFDEYGTNPDAQIWKIYVREADKFDIERVDGWNRSLDVMLNFATLFTAICTAFVIESSKSLQADSIETARARRLEQITGILSDHSWLDPELRALISSDPFLPRHVDLCVNILWFFSLILGAAVSLIAMLAKEWCYIFVSDSFGDPWSQTKRRQQRWEGMEKWKMEQVIMILPLFIHLSLLSFAIGLCIYLVDIRLGISIPATFVTIGSILIYVAPTIFPSFNLSETMRPYSTSISRFIQSLQQTTEQIAAQEPKNANQTGVEALARLIKMSEDPRSMDIALQAIVGHKSNGTRDRLAGQRPWREQS